MENKTLNDKEQLEKYKTAVENLAKSRSKFIFPNKDAQHAAIVVSSMIENSSCIKICDDDLSGDIADKSEDLRNTIEKAVHDKKIVQFLIKDVSHTDSEIYKLLKKLAKENKNLQIKKAKKGFFEKVKEDSEGIVNQRVAINFAIGDKGSFRIEFPGEQARSAFCSFNNTEISSKLLNLFEFGFDQGESIFFDETNKSL